MTEFEFTLPKLPFDYDALEPHLDALTMEIHYTRHHRAYVDNLNKALVGGDNFASPIALTTLLQKIDQYDVVIRNNAGGHYNHSFLWGSLSSEKDQDEPTGLFQDAILRDFGSFQEMTKVFSRKAMTLFGSGWTWLCTDEERKLSIVNTANQDTPLMFYAKEKLVPLLGLDLWEHAYYLKYQNRKKEYIEVFLRHLVDWLVVTKRYEEAMK